jgi:hypothetical protein
MPKKKHFPGALFIMGVIIAVGAVGMSYALWGKTLFLEGQINTGVVNTEFRQAFTDDDHVVDDPALDSLDLAVCQPGQGAGCDPAASGPDPKPRYTKDVASCTARLATNAEDADSAAGAQKGFVDILGGYPSYYCTAWFPIHNNGTIPVKVMRIDITDGQGTIIVANAIPSRVYSLDLTGDGETDLHLHLTDLALGQQIDASQTALMNLDMHVFQPAPQSTTFGFGVHVQLGQWNEVGGCIGAQNDVCIDVDGFATPGDGIPWAAEVQLGDPLTSFSREGPPNNRSGVDMFDNDVSGSWTAGDDLHTEAPVYGGTRDGIHDANDPVILDLNGDLAIGRPVDCDLDTGTFCNLIDHTLFKFYDSNLDGYWDNGEDIILDLNGNSIFD